MDKTIEVHEMVAEYLRRNGYELANRIDELDERTRRIEKQLEKLKVIS